MPQRKITFSGELKHRMNVNQIKDEIFELVDISLDYKLDPEVCWSMLRAKLMDLKKQHLASYSDYLETDSDEEAPKSEYAKHIDSQKKC